ncbi:MAG: toll/interleukin-1 receptor domain-containing protein [Acidobacteriota bacterium]
MLTVFLCHCAADKTLARDLAGFLERGTNASIYLEEGEIGPGESLLAKVQEGLMADRILVLLSPDSVPTRWRRDEWMPVFRDQPAEAGVQVASAVARDCHVPDLLRRGNFFDLTADPLKGFREIKSWLLSWQAPAGEPLFVPGANRFSGSVEELESLRRAIADQPGTAVLDRPGSTALALEFARRFRSDFEAVFWLDGGERSLAGLAGDLTAQIGLQLKGNLEANLEALRRFCAGRRFLVTLNHTADEGAPGLRAEGRSSWLVTRPCQSIPGGERLPEREGRLLAAMSTCAPGFGLELAAEVAGLSESSAQEACRSLLDGGVVLVLNEHGPRYCVVETVPHQDLARRHAETLCGRPALGTLADFELAFGRLLARQDAWPLACGLARAAFARARAEGRNAEAYELSRQLLRAAEARQDQAVIVDCCRDLAWIAEDWGREDEAAALRRLARWHCGAQMFLPGFGPASGILGS